MHQRTIGNTTENKSNTKKNFFCCSMVLRRCSLSTSYFLSRSWSMTNVLELSKPSKTTYPKNYFFLTPSIDRIFCPIDVDGWIVGFGLNCPMEWNFAGPKKKTRTERANKRGPWLHNISTTLCNDMWRQIHKKQVGFFCLFEFRNTPV